MSAKTVPAASAMPEDKPPKVLAKLITFSLLMAFVPISVYFLSAKYVWPTSNVAAAINAVIAANVILVGYVVVAFKEDAPLKPYTAQEKIVTQGKKQQ